MSASHPYAEVDLESQARPATSELPSYTPYASRYITPSRSTSQESVSRHSQRPNSAFIEKSSPTPTSQPSSWNPRSWSRKMKLTVFGIGLVVCLVPAIAIPVSHALLKGQTQVTQIAASSSATNTVARQSAVAASSTSSAEIVVYTSTVVPVISAITEVATVTPSPTLTTIVTTSSASSRIVTTELVTASPSLTTIVTSETVSSTTISSPVATLSNVNAAANAAPKIAPGIPLRVMPLGASITWGWLSTDNDGYRKDLRNMITAGGDVLNFVGTRTNGDFKDKEVEGWPGMRVEEVAVKANTAVPISLPNVILLNAGTNDCVQNFNLATVGQRMETLINSLYTMAPGTTIILSTLVLNKNATVETYVEATNTQYTALYTKLAAQGKKIVLADMHSSAGPNSTEMADPTHPNDEGYAKMANVWYAALIAAGKKGFITKAADVVPAIPADGGN